MKILYLHRTQGKGVEGVHIREVIKAFMKMGHSVDLIGPAEINIDGNGGQQRDGIISQFFKYLSKCIPEICFELLEIAYNFLTTKRLNKLAKRNKYDFIYERYAIFSWAGVKFAKKNNTPIILELSYTSFTPILRKRSKLLRGLANKIDVRMFKDADALIVVSTYLKKHLVELGISDKKIIFLTNAADPVVFSPEVPGNTVRNEYGLQGKKIVGFVGGLNHVRGLDFLLDIVPQILVKEPDCRFLLIGDGQLRGHLETRIASMDLTGKVLFAGNIPHEKLPNYIASFDIAILPHTNNYGSPMKIFEYMAMAKPVIGPKLGPVEDAIAHENNGLLFEPMNKKEIMDSLILLLKDDKMRTCMGKNAREKVINKYTWTKHAASMIVFLKNLGKLDFNDEGDT
ncbi:MAG: glycosyltransferase family 4 protein [PVC group bacterium]|nr:glycosyltransferase family 4 protein [PVC group bacterium]